MSKLSQGASAGIVLTRASRIEALLGPFDTLLSELAPDDPLEAIPVIAGHAGMRQWLAGSLARHRGAGAIVANVDFMLPSGFIDRLAEQMLGERAIGLPAWRHARLRWNIDELLRAPDGIGVTEPAIRRYLDRDAREVRRGLRRFELADRLARVYARHLVYRPDHLAAWRRGVHPLGTVPERQLLAPMWRALVARLGRHRGEVIADLVKELNHRHAPWPALHVFGVSHLAPSELAVLKAFARHAPVCVYLFDPSRDDWIGLPSGREAFLALTAATRARIDAGEEEPASCAANPLLARWGRLGQQFLAGLVDSDGIGFDVRDGADRAGAPAVDLLARVQDGIRANRVEPGPDTAQGDGRADASIRIHACHTRVRELEVLRDAVLDAIANGITPEDICVMAPDIGRYAPLVAGVFGEPGPRDDAVLPYRLGDVPLARGHRLVTSVLALLALPTRRVDVPMVLDWLGLPEVRRRQRLGEGEVAVIERWLADARVAWALDADDRAREHVPATGRWTFAWGIERLVAGYLTDGGGESSISALYSPGDGAPIAPLGNIHGPGAAALGALDALLGELARWRAFGGIERAASEWAVELRRRIEAMFEIDPNEPAARVAMGAVLAAVAGLASEPGEAGLDPVIGYDVVRSVLEERLGEVPERQPFLAGGITFCGMVPQRAIPFAMIAVLGLDEGALPRIVIDGGLDPIAAKPRFGDRDTRDDDRYLFLETLMAARRRLHLSWIGRDERDGSARSPSALLAELLTALDAMHGITDADAEVERPWLVDHPLQPFDARCFDGIDPRLHSFSTEFEAMRARDRGDEGPAAMALSSESNLEALPALETLPLSRWLRWFKDPMRELVERRLGLSMAALDESQGSSDEPLDPALDAIERWPQRLLFELVLPADSLVVLAASARPWLDAAGVLPAGRAGDAAWTGLRTVVGAAFQAWQSLPRHGDEPPLAMESLRLTLGPQIIEGRIDGIAQLADGIALVRLYSKDAAIRPEKALHFGQRVPLFIEWALLRLARASGEAAGQRVHVAALGAELDARRPWLTTIAAWDADFVAASGPARAAMVDDLVARLCVLREVYSGAIDAPWAFFPRAAFEIANGGDGQSELSGGGKREGELDYGAKPARVLGIDAGLADPSSPRYRDLADTARRVAVAIALPTTGDER